MGNLFSKAPPTVKPRDEQRVLAASQHVAPIRDALTQLGDQIQGQVLLAPNNNSSAEDDEAYHQQRERPFYLNDCNYPSAIVVVESVEDVVATLKFVQSLDRAQYKLGVAGGCHSALCMVDKTIVIDLQKINHVQVNITKEDGDDEPNTIQLGGGCKIEQAHAALQGTGFGFVTGTNGDTGVSGLTMAGGAGYLGGIGGYACDTVTMAKVVLPSGEVVTCTDDNEHQDLLRALRGGGGNFGIVVEWTFRLFDVTNCFAGTVVHMAPTMASIKTVFTNYAVVVADMPDTAYSICVCPVGGPVFVHVSTTIGEDSVKDASSYTQVPFLNQISNLGAWFRISNDLGRKDYIRDLAPMLDPVQQRTFGIGLGAMVYSFDEDIRDAIIHFTRVDYPKKNAANSCIGSMTLNGQMRKNDGSRSSLRHRKAQAWIVFNAEWAPHATPDQIRDIKDWAHRAKARIVELGGEDGPHNFCDTDGRRIKFFTDEQRDFLDKAKKKYDPTNLFSLNKNIICHAE